MCARLTLAQVHVSVSQASPKDCALTHQPRPSQRERGRGRRGRERWGARARKRERERSHTCASTLSAANVPSSSSSSTYPLISLALSRCLSLCGFTRSVRRPLSAASSVSALSLSLCLSLCLSVSLSLSLFLTAYACEGGGGAGGADVPGGRGGGLQAALSPTPNLPFKVSPRSWWSSIQSTFRAEFESWRLPVLRYSSV